MTAFQDEYDQYLCPLNQLEQEWPDEVEEYQYFVVPCRAPLHVVVTESHAFGEPVVPGGAITGEWEIVCENGHKLLSSAAIGAAGDYAEPLNKAHTALALQAIYGVPES